jgi:uncharacterized protein YegJ (DUF2314 family)
MADEPRFFGLPKGNPGMQKAVEEANATLADFRRMIVAPGARAWRPCIKTRIVSGEEEAFIWLAVVRISGSAFVGRVFEIPPQFKNIHVKDEIEVSDNCVTDWMLNRNGTLYGGFSLRYQRSLLPPEKHAQFDRQLGVTGYS